jgi:hypothetical protein
LGVVPKLLTTAKNTQNPADLKSKTAGLSDSFTSWQEQPF